MAVQNKRKQASQGNETGRADAWLNIYVTSRQGVRKQLGGLPLDKSKPAQAAFMELDADELKAAFIKLLDEGRMDLVVNSGSAAELEEGDSFI